MKSSKLAKRTAIIICAAIIVVAALAAWATWPLGEKSRLRAQTVVESRTCAVLSVEGQPVVYIGSMTKDGTIGMFSLHPDSTSCSADSARGYWTRRWALVPASKGRILSKVKPDTSRMPKLKATSLNNFVEDQRNRLDSIATILKFQDRELRYYLRSHSVIDYGYNRIAAYAQQVRLRQDSISSLLEALNKISGKSKLRLNVVTKYYLRDDSLKLVPCTVIRTYTGGAKLLEPNATPDSTGLRMSIWQARHNLPHLKPFAKPVAKNIMTDGNGYYIGHLDSIGQPSGLGRYYSTDGSYFEGFWEDGKRNGFGFSVKTRKPMRVGEWKNNVYRGEKLVYTDDRIYGIDISKHQHQKGRKRYAIDFSRLRITHLGSKSHKQIAGKVNFPVSFIFIKSTEGTTVLNPYYKSDYAAARKHGFKVGSYHFFSVRSTATKQANFFLKKSRFSRGDFPPVLDLEPLPSQIKRMGGVGELFTRVRRWLSIVENRTGKRPILYVSQQFVNNYLPQAPDIMRHYPIWIARYGEYKPDVKLVFWQLAPDGRVSGIHGDVDINVFNGFNDTFIEFHSKTMFQ